MPAPPGQAIRGADGGQVIDGGTLQCTYHGWRFAVDGRCVHIPALEDDASIPDRATLQRPAEVCETGGLVWLTPREAAHAAA